MSDSGLRSTPPGSLLPLRNYEALVRLLADFAIWFSHDWDESNSDDRAAAEQWARLYLEGGER